MVVSYVFFGLLGEFPLQRWGKIQKKTGHQKFQQKSSSTCWESFCWTSGDLFLFCGRNRFTPSWSGLCIQKSNQSTGNSIWVGWNPLQIAEAFRWWEFIFGPDLIHDMFPWDFFGFLWFLRFLVLTVYQLRWLIYADILPVFQDQHLLEISCTSWFNTSRGLVRGLALDSPKGKNRLPNRHGLF